MSHDRISPTSLTGSTSPARLLSAAPLSLHGVIELREVSKHDDPVVAQPGGLSTTT